ncbi:Protein tyrosine kinase [Carpediemonas membranifera]|uniref:Protein tyrosine kinase n=1 Tax=Carpediemonas membranifera TaxID=201153 RepID=A0A8J6E4F8_9EUKA|nr:Protein tyrosine kinase [Carpediemonas membranifera]|eukprot:KAG9394402.1 Protein tyrosine kinase [Carpediemonas membranifera]
MIAEILSLFAAIFTWSPSLVAASAVDAVFGIILVALHKFILILLYVAVLSVVVTVISMAYAFVISVCVFLFLLVIMAMSSSPEEADMVPPNPKGTPLVCLSDDQFHVTKRKELVRQDNTSVTKPFEHNEVYAGRVLPLDVKVRALAHMVDTSDYVQAADDALEAAKRQHEANITGVCRLYGYSRGPKLQFIFREHSFQTMESLLKGRLKFHWETRLTMARDLAHTMAAAHAKGLVHGAINASNVFVFRRHAKIDNFGLNKATDVDDLVAYDIEMFGRLLWRLVHRRPTPYDPANMRGPAPDGCPAELAAALVLCTGVHEKPESFDSICDILGEPQPEPQPASMVTPTLGSDEAKLMDETDTVLWENLYGSNSWE